jgi:hypothetical protein
VAAAPPACGRQGFRRFKSLPRLKEATGPLPVWAMVAGNGAVPAVDTLSTGFGARYTSPQHWESEAQPSRVHVMQRTQGTTLRLAGTGWIPAAPYSYAPMSYAEPCGLEVPI